MESTTRIQENKNPSQSSLSSPHSNNNGVQIQTQIPISRSDTNPYPTTFVQADTSTFKQVVQMLTGSTETITKPPSSPCSPSSSKIHHYHHHHQQDPQLTRNFTIPPIKNTQKKQQQENSFKLYERRNSNLKNSLMINTLLPSFGNNNNSISVTGFSPRNKQNSDQLLSPSMLDFPKLTLSPVTPFNQDPFNKTSPSNLGNNSSFSSSSEEESAIAEKGFYLHPSPISTPRDSEPQLLPLFPVTSPKVSGS